jgi:hypothetical protein
MVAMRGELLCAVVRRERRESELVFTVYTPKLIPQILLVARPLISVGFVRSCVGKEEKRGVN